MIKNDVTYEYRVFTNRLIDVEAMEVGKCTSKVVKELKAKDKVNGRFFHTSDTDEWFFCWNGELQKLNLKGDADVNNALAEVRELISKAEKAVEDANKTASEAAKAAADAQKAADAAGDAIESIENKADVSYVDTLVAQEVAGKADVSVVEALDVKVDSKATIDSVNSLTDEVKDLSGKVAAIKLDDYALKSQVPSIEGLATETFVRAEIEKIDIPNIEGKQDVISDLNEIRTNASKGATALQEVPAEYITEGELEGKGYLTADIADLKYAPIGGEGVDLSNYATKDFVGEEIAKIKIPTVPTNISVFTNDAGYINGDVLDGKGYLTAQSLGDYALKSEIPSLDGYAKITDIPSLDGYAKITDIPSLDGYAKTTDIPSMDDYYTKGEIDGKIDAINTMLDIAIEKTNTILGE